MFVVVRDENGHAMSIEFHERTLFSESPNSFYKESAVLQLQTGAELNERNVDEICEMLNSVYSFGQSWRNLWGVKSPRSTTAVFERKKVG